MAAKKKSAGPPGLTKKQILQNVADRLSVLADVGLRLKGACSLGGPPAVNLSAIVALIDAEMKLLKRYLREVHKLKNVHIEDVEFPPSGFAVAGPTHLTFMNDG